MPSIPKPNHVTLPAQDIVKLNDYKKKWLEAVCVSTVRSNTTKHKFSTLPIGLYESEPPQNVDFNFLAFFRGREDSNLQATREKVIFYKGSVFVRTEAKEEDMQVVGNEDIHAGTYSVSTEVFMQDKEDCLLFNWQGTKTVDLDSYTTTSLPVFLMSARASLTDGIRLNERQYEELISIRFSSDVSGEIDVLALDNESDSDDDAREQMGHCNLPGRSRPNRIITAPARFYDYF